MKTTITILAVLATSVAHAREWTTIHGTRFQADLIGIHGDEIRLRLDDGPITVPRSLLCPADRLYTRAFQRPTISPPTTYTPPAAKPSAAEPQAATPRPTPSRPRYKSPAEITEDRLKAHRESERRYQETLRRRAATPPLFIERTGNGPYIWWTPPPPPSSKWRPE